MLFSIMLMPADVTGRSPPYETAIEQAVQANDGQRAADGAVRLRDGGQFVFAYNQFRTERLSPALCRVVFDAALRSNTYVDTGGSELAPLKVEGSTLEIPADLGRAVPVASADALCVKLRARLAGWNRDMERLQHDGVIDADGRPLEPPADPGTEPRVSNDPLIAECDRTVGAMASQPGWKLVRRIATRNPQWGVVWRADIASGADPATLMRESCWRGPTGKKGLRFSSMPLKSFDPSSDLEPLPAE